MTAHTWEGYQDRLDYLRECCADEDPPMTIDPVSLFDFKDFVIYHPELKEASLFAVDDVPDQPELCRVRACWYKPRKQLCLNFKGRAEIQWVVLNFDKRHGCGSVTSLRAEDIDAEAAHKDVKAWAFLPDLIKTYDLKEVLYA